MIVKNPKLCRLLLEMEILGVLDRELCPTPGYLDEENSFDGTAPIKKSPSPIPPRLLFIPSEDRLVHCLGEDAFYDNNPKAGRYFYSEECYVLSASPAWLSNFDAMHDIYNRCGVTSDVEDPLSIKQARRQSVAVVKHLMQAQRSEKRAAAKARKLSRTPDKRPRLVK